ncbi:hypothetical protein [Mucilaginibacter sp. SG564]|uniref:hypothetical protein n=1 Tax=unclassified Mucilaginibacter TaxID=2617802 RepID=UPI0015565F33|nr:hypothetical protein [Mucilaginibacter sp. SG564]NOW94868.1 uncharacterized protein YydD (DUF2326 family) [Mucilaginibacter sp. SG564]
MNIDKKVILICCVIALFFAACSGHKKFSREDWDYGDGLTFPNRSGMVDDLLKNYKLKGLKYQEVIHLLHRPQQSNTAEMVYDVEEVNKKGKVIYVKKLILSLKDSVVTGTKIYEHSDKKK